MDFTPVTVVAAPETKVAISQPANGAIDIAFNGQVRMQITGAIEPALAAAPAKVLAHR